MEVSTLTTEQLEQTLEEYPWFTLARKEYVFRHKAFGDEALRCAAQAAGIFFLSRRELVEEFVEKRRGPKQDGKEKETKIEKPGVSYYIVGGDYFGKEDFREIENSGEAFNVPLLKYDPIASTLDSMETDRKQEGEERKMLQLEEPCTETLAGIYLQQNLQDKAIAIYKKLILLYPEKNTYFANLIEEAKKIKQ